jgi:hypothetical protein
LAIQLFALDIKIKAKQKNDIFQVKATIESLMYGEEGFITLQ